MNEENTTEKDTKEEKGIEILQVTEGFDFIAKAIYETDGTFDAARTILKEGIDTEDIDNSLYIKNNYFVIKNTEDVTQHLTMMAGRLMGLSDSLMGAHMMMTEEVAIIDGLAIRTLQDQNFLQGIEYKTDSTKRALFNFEALFTTEEASLKILFRGEKKEQEEGETLENVNTLSVLSGVFYDETWDFLRNIGRAVVVPRFSDRALAERRIGFVIMTAGLQTLEALVSNIDVFHPNVREDLGGLGS